MVQTKFLWSNAMADGSSTAQTESHVFNAAKLMSSANRAEYKNVSNGGKAQLYTIGMKMHATKAHGMVLTAPNTYVTKHAVQAWHDARAKMYRRAGIKMKDLGYGRSLRPYLDVNHENGTTTEIDTENSGGNSIYPPFSGDEWTYSRAAVTTPVDNTPATVVDSRDLVDTYSFTLLDASVTEDGTPDSPDESDTGSDQDSFVSVGMLKEWLGSFKKNRSHASNDTASIDEDNALLQLSGDQGPSKEEVLELAKDAQVEGRPWDLGGATHYSLAYGGLCRAVGESAYIVFQAPCGLFQVSTQSEAAAETVYTEFDVLDIRDM